MLRDGKEVPLTARQEMIQVAGAPSVRITVRSSVHGPLLSDVVDDVRDVGRSAPVARGVPARGPGYAVALAWTALTPGRTMDAIFGIDAARDFAEFRAGALKLEVPAQNLVYADVDGHIGYQAPGRIPIRSDGAQQLAGAHRRHLAAPGLGQRLRLEGVRADVAPAVGARPAGRASSSPPTRR